MVVRVAVLAVLGVGLLPAAFSSGPRRGRRSGDSARAAAVQAKEAAAEAFYELDTAQRDVQISVDTVTAVDDSPAGRRASADFAALSARINDSSSKYIAAVDAHDLEDPDLTGSDAAAARRQLEASLADLRRTKSEVERFASSLGPLVGQAEKQLARVAPAVEQAKRALLGATRAVEAVEAAKLRADDLKTRLVALAPELTLVNQGVAAHGVRETVHRADTLRQRAEQIRAEAEHLPQRKAEIDKRLVSLRTRTQALRTRSGGIEPILSELRRHYSAACWQDLQHASRVAGDALLVAEQRLTEATGGAERQEWAQATAALGTARAKLDDADAAISAVGARRDALRDAENDPAREVEKARFAVRDAQRLAMAGRAQPDPRDAEPLDRAVARIDAAEAGLTGRHPDYWHFLTELGAARDAAARVVQRIREERGAGRR